MKTILISDDNVDVKTMLKLLLVPLGHRLLTASDGISALKIAREQRPDVAILDLEMPGMNGIDVAREIRKESWSAHTVLIAATAHGSRDDKRKTTDAGFDAHLVKPFSLVELEDLLSIQK